MRIEAWIHHLERLGMADPPELPPEKSLDSGERGEQRLWRACAGEAVEIASILAPRDGRADPGLGTLVPADGPLLAPDGYLAIEVWAECELSALHALHRLERQRYEGLPPNAPSRLAAAIRWHLEHTQPDNSTNRPWALHVFLLASFANDGERTPQDRFRGIDSGSARFYAETLLHNMSATDARDEPLSRWILADAARELRAFAKAPA